MRAMRGAVFIPSSLGWGLWRVDAGGGRYARARRPEYFLGSYFMRRKSPKSGVAPTVWDRGGFACVFLRCGKNELVSTCSFMNRWMDACISPSFNGEKSVCRCCAKT